ncbi:M23 family metallopeptidase [Sphingorhabdus sp. IMCC26285]|uniref:M23 family metallopeptidase n=1 Tax=Sphingorhabdus profundilacus TaxID=2509718 RepID=A0A6I4M1U5_9SPHN|nr:M23 family metallopeptidase [Sphingorhabdus profundilacus]MVZ98050.1 M23 family metallopeptidase [Sphingorhabdus profundilacus]
MIRSALANGQSLTFKLVSALAFMVAAFTMSPAHANSAAASDSFRIKAEDLKANQSALGTSDPEFRALNNSWGRIVGASTKVEVAVPSINPVEVMKFSSGFGYRNAPTRGASRNHKGIDIPGPVGTPIYATADGVVGRAQWLGGYGKYVEINHGNAVQTRYGHLSAMNVAPGQSVRKGDILGYMGSTGRSTGSHLHYEVRIAGEAINPTAFLSPLTAESNILLASKTADNNAIGGPAENE